MKIVVASDHGGLEYKNAIKKHLILQGKEVIDVGTYTKESCHYPTFAFLAGEKVASGEVDFGFLVCTTGEGIMIAANKVKGVRAAIGYNDSVSVKSREHNDANMLAFGQAEMQLDDVLRRVDLFLATASSKEGRHGLRVKLITDYENQ
ncbi:MAG: RpiB/LacA/LacB family sugar-phosphate isomerase [Bacilli bacterium]|jgi:ribose 5-phosphate isomerase B